ncbi:MAG: hypothetical protein AAGI92_02115 [Pseudomonadota bacterium]
MTNVIHIDFNRGVPIAVETKREDLSSTILETVIQRIHVPVRHNPISRPKSLATGSIAPLY